MTSRMTLAATAVALCLAGCTQPSGPVLGEWEGNTPGRQVDYGKQVDLVLDGLPDAQSGNYNIATTEENPETFTGSGERRWGGTWTRSQRVADGRTITVITLQDHLPDDIGAYELAPDGTLHALDPNGQPDTSPMGQLYTLRPVAPRHAR